MKMTKTITYKNIQLAISRDGTLTYDGQTLRQRTLGKNGKYMYATAYDRERKCQVLVNVARAVCTAFHPLDEGEDYAAYQVDHIDCNPHNNRASNLRWMTRKDNNTRRHANEARSKAARERLSNGGWHKFSHSSQLIRATNVKDGSTLIFKTGKAAAQALGCSHVLIYRVLSPTDYAKTAKGYRLEWVDINEKGEII